MKTCSGRKRYNVPGALDVVSKKVAAVTNDAYIAAPEVCELLRKIASEYAGKEVQLVLDNARYQKCAIVKELAAAEYQPGYIPPYSPDLNLIERFQKHVKGRLRTKYHEEFSVSCETIDHIVGCSDGEDKKAVGSLIGDKVCLFDDLVPINSSTFVSKKAEGKAA
ncbi:MAG: transposase [Deltaproteobacteria bacterium]|jgi:transposase|nr:transposase [Deltaproteobacteria bacterium]